MNDLALVPATQFLSPQRVFSPQENPIFSYVAQRMISQVSPKDAENQKICRCFAKVVAVVAGCAAQIPYINLCKTYAAGNDVYAGFLIYGDFTSFSALLIWCFLTLIDDEMTPLTQEERIMLSREPPRCPPTLVKVLAIGASILSQVPQSKGVADYNDPPLVYWILSLLHFGIPLLSLSLSAQDLATKKKLNGIELQLQTIKMSLINTLENTRSSLTRLPEDRTCVILRLLNDAESGANLNIKDVTDYLQALSDASIVRRKRPSDNRCAHCSLQLTGAVLTVSQLMLTAVLGYQSGGVIADNDVGRVIISIILTLIVFSFNRNGMFDSLRGNYDTAVDLLQGQYEPPLSAQLFPRLYACSSLLAAATVALSYAAPIQLPKDNFEGALSSYMQVTNPMGIIVLVVYAMQSLVSWSVEEAIVQGVDPQAKELILLDRRIKRFIKVVQKSPLIDFAQFIKVMPENLVQKLTDGLTFSSESLDAYIRTHSSSLIIEEVAPDTPLLRDC